MSTILKCGGDPWCGATIHRPNCQAATPATTDDTLEPWPALGADWTIDPTTPLATAGRDLPRRTRQRRGVNWRRARL